MDLQNKTYTLYSQNAANEAKNGDYRTVWKMCQNSGYVRRRPKTELSERPAQKISIKANHICSAFLKVYIQCC